MRLVLAIIAALVLLTGTTTEGHAATGSDVILVLDDSGSMRTNDPDRRAVRAVTQFILRQGPQTRVGIVLFDEETRLIAPLTAADEDGKASLLATLSEIRFDGSLTDTAQAVERAIYELRFDLRADAIRSVIVLTDGVLDTGSASRDLEKAHWLRTGLVEEANQNDIRVFNIAFTDEADFQTMHMVAEGTGGEYFRALDTEQIARVLEQIDGNIRPDGVADGATDEPAVAGTGRVTEAAEAAVGGPPAGEASIGPAPARRPSVERAKPVDVIMVVAAALVLLGTVIAIYFFYRRQYGRPKFISQLSAKLAGAPKESVHAVLYDMSDEADVKRYELGDRISVIGRIPGDEPGRQYIIVRERTVGRRHATLERRGDSYWIRDENSVNGTFVNGKRIKGDVALKHGDSVFVHKHKFLFVVPDLIGSEKTEIGAARKPPAVPESPESPEPSESPESVTH